MMVAMLLLTAGLVVLGLQTPEPARRENRPSASFAISAPIDLPATPEQMARHAAVPSLLSAEDARLVNAQVPFVTDKGKPALPFRFAGSDLDRDRARDCLASAALYEAGADDPAGQRAVIQVVLNRMRHPAYPHTICGVVFQGSERQTGCQFTFSCDGAMRHRFGEETLEAARARAERFLSGEVDPSVGLATHYHTDWVHPYWSASLDKLTRVHTHLFFRWKGFWGTRPAFAERYVGNEPRIQLLSYLSAHGSGDEREAATALLTDMSTRSSDPAIHALPPARSALSPESLGVASSAMDGAQVLMVHPQGGAFLILVPSRMTKDRFANLARALCSKQAFCRIQAWDIISQVPRGFPANPSQKDTMRYQYVRESQGDSETISD